MKSVDLFTRRRLEKFVNDHRQKSGQLPTLRDFADHGIDGELIKKAIKEKFIEEFYLKLSNGSVVKGYKLTCQ